MNTLSGEEIECLCGWLKEARSMASTHFANFDPERIERELSSLITDSSPEASERKAELANKVAMWLEWRKDQPIVDSILSKLVKTIPEGLDS